MPEAEIYKPISIAWEKTQLYRFCLGLGVSDPKQLAAMTVADAGAMWAKIEQFVGLSWLKSYINPLDLSQGIPWARWFVDGRYNLALDCVDKWVRSDIHEAEVHFPGGASPVTNGKSMAVLWEGDGGENRQLSYEELYEQSIRVARGLQSLGVQPGDRIGLFLPMVPEAVIAIIAVARLGAVIVPAFSGYGVNAVSTRLNDAEVSVLITADRFYRRGQEVPMLEVAREAVRHCRSVRHVVVVDRSGHYANLNETKLNGELPWSALLAGQSSEPMVMPLESEKPFLLIYTSGSTGKPKGAVHTQSGFLVKVTSDVMFSFDVHQGDTFFWITDIGWLMGPLLILSSLALGATMLLYEGVPDWPDPSRIWHLVSKHHVTHLGLAPTAVRSLMTHGTQWVKQENLSSLRAFCSTGEPWNDQPWLWLYQQVGGGQRPILNYSGGTEIGGGILSSYPGWPQKPCSFSGPTPGMAAVVVNEACSEITDALGELAIKAAWPGMTRGFWGDPQRYLDAYWSRCTGYWIHGDLARVDADGYWFIEGRSDDTMKLAGKRVGPVEVESLLVSHSAVAEAAVVGVPDPVKGQALVAFVVIRPGFTARDALATELANYVAANLGKPFRPSEVIFVNELPRTRNAKILRRVLRAVYTGAETGDLSSLENPESLEEIRKGITRITE